VPKFVPVPIFDCKSPGETEVLGLDALDSSRAVIQLLLMLPRWLAGIFRVQQLRALDFIGSGNRYESTTRNINRKPPLRRSDSRWTISVTARIRMLLVARTPARRSHLLGVTTPNVKNRTLTILSTL
jgi:hypothetical protein